MTLPSTYSRYILSERPGTGEITSTTFKLERRPIDDLNLTNPEQVVVQVTWLSLDPAMRSWLNDADRPYTPPVKLGEVMRARGLGVVVHVGAKSKFAIGDRVVGNLGWTEYVSMKDSALKELITPPGAQELDHLGMLGYPGLTAYFGLLDVGQLKPGETLVVSGAAGAVGSAVCQIGKLKGAKVIAIAGGPEKCAWLKDHIGVDAAFDYKSPHFHNEFKQSGVLVDVYFDNVGGDMLNFMLNRLNMKARVVICGAISDYNRKPTGLTSYTRLLSQRARMEGFVVTDYVAQFPTALEEMSKWIAAGSLKQKYHIVEGLENAPEALSMLFRGSNVGKLVLKVSDHGGFETTPRL